MDKPIRDIPPEKRRSYQHHKKEWERLRIRQDLKEGMSEAEIQKKYKMSWNTFWNRLNEIRMEDNKIILEKLRAEEGSYLVVDIKRLDDRMGDAIQHMNRIINDDKASHFVKIEAERLRMEIALAQLKLKVEGVRLLDEISMPAHKVITGQTAPIEALEQLPRLNRVSKEEKERLKWVAQGQVEKETAASEPKKEA